ncbi:hypothetical protein BXU10_24310 [Flavobacterium sp. LM4]|nr:hypothetical protein BXU10_24310 [Flavobacterium sp. LM4]
MFSFLGFWFLFFLCLQVTFPRYKQFGIKSALSFGFAKSSKYKPIFPLSQIPKLLVACVTKRLFNSIHFIFEI